MNNINVWEIITKEKQAISALIEMKKRISTLIANMNEQRRKGAHPVDISNKFYIYLDILKKEKFSDKLIKDAITKFNSFQL